MTKANESTKKLHISVRNLVEFIFREGDIDNRFGRTASAETMQEGTRIHRMIQKSQGDGYQAEVPLRISLEEELYTMTIDGRADGIFKDQILPGDKPGAAYEQEIIDKKKVLENPEQEPAFPEVNSFMSLPLFQESLQLEEIPEFLLAPDEISTPITWIDEIKGVYRRVDRMKNPVYVHLAQAKCYAYIHALDHDLKRIGIRMTYCNMDTKAIRYFRYIYTFSELETWFLDLWKEYKKWADFECIWKEKRQASIKSLTFPFPYREGQKQLAGDVYRTILREKILFIQAPTGVGKTITTLFPAIKAVGEGLADRIFYLTAKTVTATVAKETFQLLAEKGYRGKVVHLTAKEKMCLCETTDCNPVSCPYAKGHFDRINDAVFNLLQREDHYERDLIWEQAKEFMVCPFELSLDMSSFCDDIICDYNYLFDPKVNLKRFFAEGIKGEYLFLIDEAHNLVDRSREMYSASLYKEDFLSAKKLLKPYEKRNEEKKLIRLMEKCNRVMLEYKRESTENESPSKEGRKSSYGFQSNSYQLHTNIQPLTLSLEKLEAQLSEYLEPSENSVPIPERKDLLDFYFRIRDFLSIFELVDDHYVMYSEVQEDGSYMLRLYCVDPSLNIQKCLDKGRSTIFFSATLLPIQYYKSLLSTQEDNYAIYAHSTFDPARQMILLGRGVSTKYTRRNQQEYQRIAFYIKRTVDAKQGNYMIFFPSYKYMEQVFNLFTHEYAETGDNPDTGKKIENDDNSKNEIPTCEIRPQHIKCIAQTSGMNEEEREAFLREFDHTGDYTLIAFCIMGGIFGEGIDLKNEKLIGSIIVGTGLPQISNEKEILRSYYEENGKNGFDYAYRYPGMNKVLQAAGRVIRTEEDTGVVILLDERFFNAEYVPLFPREWERRQATNLERITADLEQFWN